jgi:hypothetical protein
MILKRAVSTRERDYVTRFDEEFFIPRSIVGRAEDTSMTKCVGL